VSAHIMAEATTYRDVLDRYRMVATSRGSEGPL